MNKHRPTLNDVGPRSLDISRDPRRGEKCMLLVEVEPRPNFTSIETSYRVLSADVVPLDAFGTRTADELLAQLRRDVQGQNEVGMNTLSEMFVAFLCEKQNVFNYVGIAYTEEDALLCPTGADGSRWKEQLIHSLNDGIVY